MELSPEEKRRIYEEEKVRIEAQEQIKKQLVERKKAENEKEASKFVNKGCLGCLIVIGIIILFSILPTLFGPQKEGKDLSTVEYEASCYSEAYKVVDTPDRKEWMVKFGGTAQMFIATRQPNGYWKTELQDLRIPVR